MADEIVIREQQIWKRHALKVYGTVVDALVKNDDHPDAPSALVEWKNGVRSIWRHSALREQELIRDEHAPLDILPKRQWQGAATGKTLTVDYVEWDAAEMRWMVNLDFDDHDEWILLSEAELRGHFTSLPGRAHDFSDRYCATRRGLMCAACGMTENGAASHSPPESVFCRPIAGWREEMEERLGSSSGSFWRLAPKELVPQPGFRQSHTLTTGGIWSLRDETR